MATRPDDLIYTVDEIPPLQRLLLLGLQNLVLISIYFVLIVIIFKAQGVLIRSQSMPFAWE